MTNTSAPIEYFKREAKKLFGQVDAGEAEALARVMGVLKDSEEISLMRVQHVIAVEAGFLKWENLIKASAIELQSLISRTKELPKDQQVKLRVPPPGETPLVSFLRGPFNTVKAKGLVSGGPLKEFKRKDLLQRLSGSWNKNEQLRNFSLVIAEILSRQTTDGRCRHESAIVYSNLDLVLGLLKKLNEVMSEFETASKESSEKNFMVGVTTALVDLFEVSKPRSEK